MCQFKGLGNKAWSKTAASPWIFKLIITEYVVDTTYKTVWFEKDSDI